MLYAMSLNCCLYCVMPASALPSARSLIVSVGVLALGATSIHFVEPGVKVNRRIYYRKVLLMQKRLSDIHQLSEFYVFQQDSAPTLRARETVDLLTRETPDFISFTLCRQTVRT